MVVMHEGTATLQIPIGWHFIVFREQGNEPVGISGNEAWVSEMTIVTLRSHVYHIKLI